MGHKHREKNNQKAEAQRHAGASQKWCAGGGEKGGAKIVYERLGTKIHTTELDRTQKIHA